MKHALHNYTTKRIGLVAAISLFLLLTNPFQIFGRLKLDISQPFIELVDRGNDPRSEYDRMSEERGYKQVTYTPDLQVVPDIELITAFLLMVVIGSLGWSYFDKSGH